MHAGEDDELTRKADDEARDNRREVKQPVDRHRDIAGQVIADRPGNAQGDKAHDDKHADRCEQHPQEIRNDLVDALVDIFQHPDRQDNRNDGSGIFRVGHRESKQMDRRAGIVDYRRIHQHARDRHRHERIRVELLRAGIGQQERQEVEWNVRYNA